MCILKIVAILPYRSLREGNGDIFSSTHCLDWYILLGDSIRGEPNSGSDTPTIYSIMIDNI